MNIFQGFYGIPSFTEKFEDKKNIFSQTSNGNVIVVDANS